MKITDTLAVLAHLRELSPARIGLGHSGSSMPTAANLDFAWAHAAARDAVYTALDTQAVAEQLQPLFPVQLTVQSQAYDRETYLKRPDLGKLLHDESADMLQQWKSTSGYALTIVLCDGLSPQAIQQHAAPFLEHLFPMLQHANIAYAPLCIATQGRVALGDAISEVLSSQLVLVLIGERPGLSSPHSMGAYLTYNPFPGITDNHRNCLSNIHAQGLSYASAAQSCAYLIQEALKQKLTGVVLKNNSSIAALK